MNTSNITNYKPKDFAELLGISVKTLQRWDREGILKANRTPTDRRYYTYDQYLQYCVVSRAKRGMADSLTSSMETCCFSRRTPVSAQRFWSRR